MPPPRDVPIRVETVPDPVLLVHRAAGLLHENRGLIHRYLTFPRRSWPGPDCPWCWLRVYDRLRVDEWFD